MVIDSKQVPWGKGEKQPGEGDEIVSETVCLQWAEGLTESQDLVADRIPIEEWACECAMRRVPKSVKADGGEGKPSLNGR